jgi:hypothetical protein
VNGDLYVGKGRCVMRKSMAVAYVATMLVAVAISLVVVGGPLKYEGRFAIALIMPLPITDPNVSYLPDGRKLVENWSWSLALARPGDPWPACPYLGGDPVDPLWQADAMWVTLSYREDATHTGDIWGTMHFVKYKLGAGIPTVPYAWAWDLEFRGDWLATRAFVEFRGVGYGDWAGWEMTGQGAETQNHVIVLIGQVTKAP